MNRTDDIWAVVPVKDLEHAKTRLSSACSPQFRRGLARAMLEDVLAALSSVPELAGIAVVTIDAAATELARHYGAQIFEDGARDGHTGAVMAAAQRLAREGRSGMLTVPGDVPEITPAEIARVCTLNRATPSFTIVPAHDRRGSNAIVMRPPTAVPLAFGDDSFLPHLEAARKAGIEPTVVTMPGIGLDIDNCDDLELLSRARSSSRSWHFVAAHRLTSPSTAV